MIIVCITETLLTCATAAQRSTKESSLIMKISRSGRMLMNREATSDNH